MRFFSTLAASFLGTLLGLGLLFLFGLLFVFALASTSEQAPTVRSGSVLVAELSGAYPEAVSGDPIAQAFGSESRLDLHDVTRAFRMAASDDRIDGVWLKMGDLQTDWASLDAIRRSIQEVRATGKRVIATSSRFYLGEDELFVASAADSILLDPEALFEFNGFALQMTFFKRLMEKAGVAPQAVRAGRFKSAVEPYLREDLSDANREQLEALLTDIQASFNDALSASRSIEPAELTRLAQAGNVMNARSALTAGLIDGLAYSDEVEAAFGEEIKTINLTRYARSPASAAGIKSGRDGEIAVVIAEGTIVAGGRSAFPGAGGSEIGSATFAKAMERARTDDDVDAVVLRINSPGGFAPAADAMLREILLTKKTKPIVVSMGGLAASGGYWIAAPADTIVAEPLTLTGSIGVFGLMMDFSELMEERIGVTFDGVQTAPSADLNSGTRGLSTSERAALEASIDQTYAEFLRIVAEGRHMTTDQVHALAQGRVWTGRAAKEIGLVDVLGGLDTAVALAAERAHLEPGSYQVREFPRPATFVERFSEALEARIVGPSPFEVYLPSPLSAALGGLRALAQMPPGVHARLPFTIEIR
ncbi:MAG: protease-4 [Rhodothermales bacterium]|jgi:protease-4